MEMIKDMEFTYNRKSFGEVAVKRIRCMPVWLKGVAKSGGALFPCASGVVYQVQEGRFVDQGDLKVFYTEDYLNCRDPLYPDLTLDAGFNELLKEIHPKNLFHPLVIYGLLSNTGPVNRSPVYMVKTKDLGPMVFLDAMTGGELGMAPSSVTCARDFIKKEVLARIGNMEFWENEVTHHEDIYGRPRTRHYPNPNARQ